jgi:cytochrome oxidase Cu insertion factor (SCO1/SenC/PrrC family)
MNSGLNPADPIIVSAFRTALLYQFAIVCVIFMGLLLAWAVLRGRSGSGAALPPDAGWREPGARRLLRIGFGVLWLFDGILQAQPQMAAGLPGQVIQPAAAASPPWVQHLVSLGTNIWTFHPVQAAASAVWIQVGIGLWLIFAVRGLPSRLAGLASVAWGLVVWAFGEAFGGVFAPGLTALFGAPGAALLYVAAGLLIALPERAWLTPRLGRLVLGAAGAFFLGMAALQAWPASGFWQGTAAGRPGPLASMITTMAGTPQPRFLSSLLAAFGRFTAAHGWGVNLFAVMTLAALGAGFAASAALPAGGRLTGAALARLTALAGAAACLADWVLVQDFGFFGGTGTDPNSMVPLTLLLVAGALAMTPQPRAAERSLVAVPGQAPPASRRTRLAALSGQSVAAAGALGVVLVGAAPMASATVNRNADPIIAQALAGQSAPLDTPAAGFTLTSQDGRRVALAGLRGKAVLLAFLDPVCTTDCPVIAAEMRAADTLLGPRAKDVELVAVVANPAYTSVAVTRAFTRQGGLAGVPNWLYLTGSLSQLRKVWSDYGIEVATMPAGAMVAHNDVAFVIDPAGRIREEIDDDPGPGTASTQSSFAGLMASSALQAMGPGR